MNIIDQIADERDKAQQENKQLKGRIKQLEKELLECNAHRERLIVSSMEAWGRIDEQEGR